MSLLIELPMDNFHCMKHDFFMELFREALHQKRVIRETVYGSVDAAENKKKYLWSRMRYSNFRPKGKFSGRSSYCNSCSEVTLNVSRRGDREWEIEGWCKRRDCVNY